jgi:type II secretory pathway predicted ATPase ExeA
MIRQHFGLTKDPFIIDDQASLLTHQQRHFDILKVHSQQGGFCLIIGEPGTGKTVLKNHLIYHNPKQWITPVINRSLHSWHNILRLLCQAFDLESTGNDHKCEARLIKEARHLNTKGKILIPIIDDAHLIPIEALRKLRLLLEDFPKNHNLILIGQPALNTTLQLRPNQDLKSRITYSAKLEQLTASDLATYIHNQLERVGLPHTTFTEAATNLITRSAEGTLRAVKNLCIGSMIEAVRDRTKTIDLPQVNTVLLQPHWRHNQTNEPTEPVLIPPQNLPPRS